MQTAKTGVAANANRTRTGDYLRGSGLWTAVPDRTGTLQAIRDTAPTAAQEAHGLGTPVAAANSKMAFVLNFLPFEMRMVRREGVRLFNVIYYDGGLASLLERPDRSCRVKYDPRDLTAVFVELPGEGHLRVAYADLGRPPISLWEQRAAVQRLREQGRASVDEAAITAAIAEQRETLAAAQAKSKAARRSIARMPRIASAQGPATPAPPPDPTDQAEMPMINGTEAWMTEFLP